MLLVKLDVIPGGEHRGKCVWGVIFREAGLIGSMLQVRVKGELSGFQSDRCAWVDAANTNAWIVSAFFGI